MLRINCGMPAAIAVGAVLLAGVARTAVSNYREQLHDALGKAAAERTRLGLTDRAAAQKYPTPEIDFNTPANIAPGATGEVSAKGKFVPGTTFLVDNAHVTLSDQKSSASEFRANLKVDDQATGLSVRERIIMLVAISPVSGRMRSCQIAMINDPTQPKGPQKKAHGAAAILPAAPTATPSKPASETAATPAPAIPEVAAVAPLTAAQAPGPDGTPAKKPGTVRIGIAMPKAQLGQGAQGPSVGEPVRGIIASFLAGPGLETVPLNALLPSQADAEAKEKQCDYVVFSSLTQKKSGGGGFGLLRGATTMGSYVPMMSSAHGAAGNVAAASMATSAAVNAQQAASVSSAIKSKSEVTLDFALHTPGSPAPLVSNSLKAKAKMDGEDVVTPLVEQAATAMVAEIGKKK